MKNDKKRTVMLAVLMSFMMVNLVPLGGGSHGSDWDQSLIVWPYEEADPWTDSLDDMSHVYMPPGGLAGVQVIGGEARLSSGQSEGWIASSVITAPPDHRYDMVYIEASTPGGSKVTISVLNATQEASEIGFANETIEPYKKVEGTDLIVYGLSPTKYPQLRIQVNLVANGTAKPTVQGWSLHFTGLEMWKDDFLTTSKMLEVGGFNMTTGALELDLSRKSSGSTGGTGTYEKYPPIVVTKYGTGGSDEYYIYKANAARNGYKAKAAVASTGTYALEFDDLDGDGNLDLILANRFHSGSDVDSKIYWGDGTETWSATGATALNAPRAWKMDTGDVNGDGEPDIVFGCNAAGGREAKVFLNQGSGSFNHEADITLSFSNAISVTVGDLNNDGYDDTIFTSQTSAKVYNGGSNGPDDTPDKTFPTTDSVYDTTIGDFDQDGFNDVFISSDDDAKSSVFLGGQNGPDLTADYKLPNGGSGNSYSNSYGDLDGDGFIDLVATGSTTGAYPINIFWGSATGWGGSIQSVMMSYWTYALEVRDINKDGYDDLIGAAGQQFKIWMGGETFSSTAAHEDNSLYYPYDLAIAIPEGNIGGGIRAYRGSFTTNAIVLPEGKRWDMVSLDALLPQNTSVSMSILDGTKKEIAGFSAIEGTSVDLSPLSGMPSIHVRVNALSDLNTTTPTLDRLIVKWMDENVWRDEFMGSARADRVMGFGIIDGILQPLADASQAPQLLFANMRDDEGFNPNSIAYRDGGSLDYIGATSIPFASHGASAVDVTDANGDGHQDVVFATMRTSDTNYRAQSDLFLGTSVGYRSSPDVRFPTVGASDVLMQDLNGDGHTDVVFAQEFDGESYFVNSTLFWGSADGWSETPDVEFTTTGASGVDAADLDGDGLLDLAFSCYKAASTATDSMVYLQEATGFCGTIPSNLLPTKGAKAVTAADVDNDGRLDLVFANSFHGGFAKVDSYVYWGVGDGTFGSTPSGLETQGATDVEVADLDNDGDMDLVFSNYLDNSQDHSIFSFVYLNKGTRTFADTPDRLLPTMGASAVAVADLDGTGWKDLVFACQYNGTGYEIPSVVYLGGANGWSSVPDIELPTLGAADVMAPRLIDASEGYYMSRSITVDPVKVGNFETFRYTATLGTSKTASIQIVDADTWEVLTQTSVLDGANAWEVVGSFWVKEHPSIRVVVTSDTLDGPGDMEIDNLWLNWSHRVFMAPIVEGVELSASSVYRTNSVAINVTVADEFDPARQLNVIVEHALVGSDEWETHLLGTLRFSDGAWRAPIKPLVNAQVGAYTFRAKVVDSDGQTSGYIAFPEVELSVLNNLPTTPEVRLTPARPVTTSSLNVEIFTKATDIESHLIAYRYKWYRNGELADNVTGDSLPFSLTSRGDNWTVEVRAWDGD
jgi:hypothetical protein